MTFNPQTIPSTPQQKFQQHFILGKFFRVAELNTVICKREYDEKKRKNSSYFVSGKMENE
jgi:hypothetical protein